MKSIIRLFVCLLLLVGWGLAALSLHVIRVPGDIPISLVTKDRFGVSDTYVDTTKWTLEDVGQHPDLVAKLIRTGRADVLKHVCGDSRSSDVAEQLNDAVKDAARKDAVSKSTQPISVEQAARTIFGFFR